jgi:hypothetical protein
MPNQDPVEVHAPAGLSRIFLWWVENVLLAPSL